MFDFALSLLLLLLGSHQPHPGPLKTGVGGAGEGISTYQGMQILQGLRSIRPMGKTTYVCMKHNFFEMNYICRVSDTGSISHSRVLTRPTFHITQVQVFSSDELSLFSVLWASLWIIGNQIIDKVDAERRDNKARVAPGDPIELWEITSWLWTLIRGTGNTTRHLMFEVGWLIPSH